MCCSDIVVRLFVCNWDISRRRQRQVFLCMRCVERFDCYRRCCVDEGCVWSGFRGSGGQKQGCVSEM